MGKLSGLVLPVDKVEASPGQFLELRAISFSDISRLATRHGPILAMIYAKFTEEKKHGLSPESIGMFVSTIANQFPEIVAEVIAISNDDPSAAHVVMKLPVGVQLEAIEKIVALTFTGEADVKKLVEIVTRMARGVQESMNSLNAPTIPSGSGNGSFASN